MNKFYVLIVWVVCSFGLGAAIVCYSCRADDSSCNTGECHGMTCLKMETSNMDNERRTIQKACSPSLEQVLCTQSGFGSKLITRCSCVSDYCNGDDFLSAAGFQLSLSFNRGPSLVCSMVTLILGLFRV